MIDNSRLVTEFGMQFRPYRERVLQIINEVRAEEGKPRYCQLKRPWYARRVGGAAARVGELSLLAYHAAPLKPSGAGKRRSGSAKLTMRDGDIGAAKLAQVR
jgi:hypothetical protein